MKYLIVVLFSIVAFASAQDEFNPYVAGEYTINKTDLPRELTNISFNLDIWSPQEAGVYPFMLLLDSFAAITPGEAYDVVMERIASHGFVVVNMWSLRGPILRIEEVPLVQESLDWCEENLEDYLYPGVIVNYTASFGMGHSAGSAIFCHYLEEDCGEFKGMMWASPVDGNDPTGVVPPLCVGRDGDLAFNLPMLILPVGLDPIPAGNGSQSCAPEEISNRHFYDALDPEVPKWYLNATTFGHADFLDQEFVDRNINLEFCAYNEDNTLNDYNTYRDFVAGTVVSFMKGVLEDDCSPYMQYIEDPSAMIVPTEVEFERNGCPTPYCTNPQ